MGCSGGGGGGGGDSSVGGDGGCDGGGGGGGGGGDGGGGTIHLHSITPAAPLAAPWKPRIKPKLIKETFMACLIASSFATHKGHRWRAAGSGRRTRRGVAGGWDRKFSF